MTTELDAIAEMEAHIAQLRADPLRRAVDYVYRWEKSGLFVGVTNGKPHAANLLGAASASTWKGLGDVVNGHGERPVRILRRDAYPLAIEAMEKAIATLKARL